MLLCQRWCSVLVTVAGRTGCKLFVIYGWSHNFAKSKTVVSHLHPMRTWCRTSSIRNDLPNHGSDTISVISALVRVHPGRWHPCVCIPRDTWRRSNQHTAVNLPNITRCGGHLRICVTIRSRVHGALPPSTGCLWMYVPLLLKKGHLMFC